MNGAGSLDGASRLRAALEAGTSGVGFWRAVRDERGLAVDLTLIDANDAFGAWYGREPDQMIGQVYSDLFPDGVADRLPRYLAAMERGSTDQIRREYTTPQGQSSTYDIRIAPCGPDELFAGLWDVGDIATFEREMSEARAALTDSNDALEAALNASSDGCVVCRAERGPTGSVTAVRVVFMNEVGAAPTGRTPAQLRGLELRELFPEAVESGTWAHVLEAFECGKQQTFIVATESVGGWAGSFENVITPFSDDGAVLTWRDVSRSGTTVVRPSDDALTGLPTRGSFRRALNARIKQVGVDGVLVLVDLDRFGLVDDEHGWRTGDLALIDVARRLRSLVPAAEPIARVDADEFAFVLPHSVAISDLERVLQQFHRIEVGAGTLRLTASAGIRQLEVGVDVDRLMQEANAACRVALSDGGDRVVEHDSGLPERLLASNLQGEHIRSAVERGEFVLAFQPIVELEDAHEWGYEALVRWRHPRHGLMDPHRFIPAAEASRSIIELGRWIVDAAAKAALQAPPLHRIALNVSVIQLLHDDVVDAILRASERYGVDPARFGMEITESELIDDVPRILGQLHRARAEGIVIAIDDFGSGYSSLRYLDQLPIDIVKIDSVFFREPLSDRRAEVIAASVALANAVEATALAEGLEVQAQADAAREAGVVLGQGWFFGRPGALEPLRSVV
jgi:diguanylate cyclase (GGDEF)-like protein